MRAWIQLLLRTQPLMPVALLFIAGIVLQRAIDFGPAALLVLIAFAAVVRCASALVGRGLLILAIGATIHWARYAPLSENDLRVLLSGEPAIVAVRGTLSETPQLRDTTELSTARLRVSEIKIGNEWQPARGEIMTRTRGILPDSYFEGREVEFSGVISSPRGPQAPGLFDFRAYLKNQRIFFQLAAESPAEWKPLREQPVPRKEKLRRWAKQQIARGLPEDDQVRMLWAMTLGWRTAMSGEMAEPFMRTGTLHIVAISGLHVACITAMLVHLARLFFISRHQCAAVVIPLIWAYTILTGWQSSGVRSAVMSTALIAGWSLKRPTALLNSTAAAALLILVFEPEQLFQAGFQLSFVVVASMALLIEKLEIAFVAELPHDPLLPRALWPIWKQRANRFFSRYLRPNLIVSIACFFGSLPLTAYYFNLFTPVSLLANLVAVPLSSLALVFSMASLVPLPGFPFLQWFSWWCIKATIWCAQAFEKLGGFYYVPRPDPLFLLLYFTLALLVLTGWLWRKPSRNWAIPLLALLSAAWISSRPTAPVIHILPVAGSPIWADLRGSAHDLLVDCSDEHGFEYGLKRFLRAQGVGRIPKLLLTHGDVDHVGGFAATLRAFSPVRVFTSPHSSRSAAHKNALQLLGGIESKWTRLKRGDSIGAWQVLHPLDRKFPRAEDNTVVLKTVVDDWRVLIIPDLGRDGQRALLESSNDLASDILLLGIPERAGSIDEALIERIAPQLVILGAGRPHIRTDRILKALRATDAILFTTAEDGAVRLEFDNARCTASGINGRTHTLKARGGLVPRVQIPAPAGILCFGLIAILGAAKCHRLTARCI